MSRMDKKKICIITGSRAEYGLLKNLMRIFDDSTDFTLQILVTGMHLSSEFGLTYKEIESDGFTISKKVEILLSSDTPSSIAKSMGLGMISFGDALEDLKPDLVVLLGDRTEIFSAASVCLIMQIPIAHLHGGETTEGAYDEALRHSITKMSHLHFVAAEEYRKRVIQLGEDPSSVHLVGGLGVDAIHQIALWPKVELEKQLNFSFGEKNLLITYHPVTLENHTSKDFQNLLTALESYPDINLIFTLPNSDAGAREIIIMIQNFCNTRKNSKFFTSLGQQKYFSMLQFVDGVIGNSSSGLLEVPTFHKGTINIGNRQKGRLKADSVIDCEPIVDELQISIEKLYSLEFQNTLKQAKNPYGDGGAAKKIFQTLSEFDLKNFDMKKSFYDTTRQDSFPINKSSNL